MWLINQNLAKTQIFLNGLENSLFFSQFSPLNAGNRLLRLCNFKIFWGNMPPYTPRKCRLLIQSVTLFKSAGYFNFNWNPCFTYDCNSKGALHLFFFRKVFLLSVSTHTIIKHNSFEYLYLLEFEWEGEGGGHLFKAGRLWTFSAFRVGAYSNKYSMPVMLLCNIYGVVITLQALPMPNPSSKSYSLV